MTYVFEDNYVYFSVCAGNEIPVGDKIFIEILDLPIVVYNIDGEFYAIADLCTHSECALGDGELAGYEVICPCHGARFDVRSGKVISLPAIKDVANYPIRIVNDMLEIGVPAQ